MHFSQSQDLDKDQEKQRRSKNDYISFKYNLISILYDFVEFLGILIYGVQSKSYICLISERMFIYHLLFLKYKL